MTTPKKSKHDQDDRHASQERDAANRSPTTSRSLFPERTFLVKIAIFLSAGILLIVAMGIAQRIGWISAGDGQATSSPTGGNEVYTCPMHPQIRQPTAGRCPICGMALVVASSAGADLDELSVKIQPAQRRLSNIATSTAKREPVSATIQTIGAIAIDESRMSTIATYIDGRLERLFADYTGVDVAQGDHLAVIYSPELHRAQVEYLTSQKSLDALTPNALDSFRKALTELATNLRKKLVELGMTETQIVELEESRLAKSRLTIHAPIGGTVIEKMAVEGKYVKAGEPIYRIADLSTVWLMLELYPEDAARIRYGQRVESEMQSLPGQVFNGRVAFIDRSVNPKSRTVGVRVEFLNNGGELRPGDYANATIFLPIGQQGEVYDSGLAGRWISPMHPQIISDQPGECPICGMDLVPTSKYGYSEIPVEQPTALYVPRSAVLMAGDQSVIYVETEPGRFEIRAVTLGPILRDKVIILGGIRADEIVATAGNFLIDSQMQLAGKPSLIDPSRAIVAQRERKAPLEFADVHITTISGASGEDLEALFTVYFAIQKSLAADKEPTESDATTLHHLATLLAANPVLPERAQSQLDLIAQHSEHLHHLDLGKARLDAFRPISHAAVALATLVRGDRAATSFHHMFCPMVKGGSGDWLQPNEKLVNPYWGSQMLNCGDVVQEFPARSTPQPTADNGVQDQRTDPPLRTEDNR